MHHVPTLVLEASAKALGALPVSVREVAGGFLSRAFVVACEKDGREILAFVRMKKNPEPGSYEDIDQRDTFHRSHLGASNAVGHPKSLFVTEIPSASGTPVVLHGQEFRPAKDGLDYGTLVASEKI